MEKLDLTRFYKSYYSTPAKPMLIDIGEAQYLSINGKGDPSGQAFADKIQALYATAYVIKFMYKDLGKDFVVAKLEGLWDFDEQKYSNISIGDAPKKVPRAEWNYKLLIRLPEYVSEDAINAAIGQVLEKKQINLAREVEFYKMCEGPCIQMLHKGAFDKEPETLQCMMDFLKDGDWIKNGRHHEIYLSDFRRVAPENLRTILREPIKKS